MFWAIGLGLLLLAAVLTVWPLLTGAGRARVGALLLVLIIPAVSILLYFDVGTPAALDPAARAPVDLAADDMDDLTQRLRARLTETPEDLEGWVLLGRTYKQLQRYDDAVAALETADRLVPEQPVVEVELVEARLFASGDPRITSEMVALLEQAVEAQPDLQKGYWLLGIAAAQRGDDRAAVDWWQKLLAQVEPGSGVAQAVERQVAEARARLGEAPPAAVADPAAGQDPETATEDSLAVEIALPDTAREALGELPPDAALFVIVRPAGTEGGPPLGVRRVDRPEFPVSVTLTDADSMLPQRPISTAETIEIQARLSLTGQPMAAAGDWQSAPAGASPAETTQLLLDQPVE